MCYKPLYDEDFETAARKWKEEFAAWERGERSNYCKDEQMEFWEYNGNPPDREYYRPAWKPEDATWLQVYQTVSEGTPVTPPFATREELIDYLCTTGDFWSDGPFSREAATAFVSSGWVPSMIVSDGVITQGIESAAIFPGADPAKNE